MSINTGKGDGQMTFKVTALVSCIVCLLASCQSSDDRVWADYSRGVDHVLKR